MFLESVSSKFEITKVAGIEGGIRNINCGSNDYCYVVEFIPDVGSKFHEMSSGKKVISTKEFKEIVALSLNEENTAYLFESNSGKIENDLQYTIYMKKNDWKNFTVIYRWKMDAQKELKIFLDKHNYLFATMEHGPVVFKPDRNVPIALYINSEMLKFNSFESDSRGNVYFQTGKSENQGVAVFRITKEETEIKIPQAQRISNIASNDETEINSIGMSINGGVFFATSNFVTYPPTSNITKLKGNHLQLILGQFKTKFQFICTTNDRLYFTSKTIVMINDVSMSENIFINFIDMDDEVTAIQPSVPIMGLSIEKDKCQEDSDGNVFFPAGNSILKIEKGKTILTEIITDSYQNITSVLIDQNNDLWALGEKVYFIKRGTTMVETIDLVVGKESLLEENRRQAEVLIGTLKGLYAVSKGKV